jgi:threonyl-tRNA synthetase
MVAITLPDGSVRDFDRSVTGAELAADIGPGLAKAALAIYIDGDLMDLSTEISSDSDVAILTAKDEAALELLRHDAAHVMAGHHRAGDRERILLRLRPARTL